MKLSYFLRSVLAFLALTATSTAIAYDSFDLDPYSNERLVNLKGKWRFTIGDDIRWASPDFNDKSWSKISTPNDWEGEGYREYNGYAWYRKEFRFSSSDLDKSTFIYLGKIDDTDQVFINGQPIGSTGQFPPNYVTAYNDKRAYMIPSNLLHSGSDNLVAVRVYDGTGRGGIYSGRLGIYESELPNLRVNLSGEWIFRTGDDIAWAATDADESDFYTIRAPGIWEDQGYQNYDGFAWYRKTFTMSEINREETMVLLLGKIDDYDEVYLNGEKVGSTGPINSLDTPGRNSYYSQNRGYYFPANILKAKNTIAIRVYDEQAGGGIYTGPLGIISQTQYIQYWEKRRERHSILNDIRRHFD